MGSLIAGPTTALLSVALDAVEMRQQAIAQNIANVNTPGYRPVEVSFDAHLSDARAMLAQGKPVPPAALADIRPRLELMPADGAGNAKVALDMEAAKLAENTLRHQILLKALIQHFTTLGSAITDGGGKR